MPLWARPSTLTRLCFVTQCLLPVVGASAADTNDSNRLKPHQAISAERPPKSPAIFNPDPNRLSPPTNLPSATNWSRSISISTNAPPEPPLQFNPDPGASLKPPVVQSIPPLFRDEVAAPPLFAPPPVRPDQALPRSDLRQGEIVPPQPPAPGNYGLEPLPKN